MGSVTDPEVVLGISLLNNGGASNDEARVGDQKTLSQDNADSELAAGHTPNAVGAITATGDAQAGTDQQLDEVDASTSEAETDPELEVDFFTTCITCHTSQQWHYCRACGRVQCGICTVHHQCTYCTAFICSWCSNTHHNVCEDKLHPGDRLDASSIDDLVATSSDEELISGDATPVAQHPANDSGNFMSPGKPCVHEGTQAWSAGAIMEPALSTAEGSVTDPTATPGGEAGGVES